MTVVMRAASYGAPEVLRVFDETVRAPGPGEVTIEVRAAGVNPTDYKGISGAMNSDPLRLPLGLGYEVAGVLAAIGPDTEIASGGGALGDAVIAFRIDGGYAAFTTVPAKDVFAKPDTIGFPEAANLLLVGATAADMVRVVPVTEGDAVVVHGASGAVGVSLLQQLRLAGVRAIGTSSRERFGVVEAYGGVPVTYGDGLLERIRALAPHGIAAAFDCIGTDEAADVSLALVEPARLVTIANQGRAKSDGFKAVGGNQPESGAYRDSVRATLIALASTGDLVVPIARTFPLEHAVQALQLLATGHPGGKLALLP